MMRRILIVSLAILIVSLNVHAGLTAAASLPPVGQAGGDMSVQMNAAGEAMPCDHDGNDCCNSGLCAYFCGSFTGALPMPCLRHSGVVGPAAIFPTVRQQTLGYRSSPPSPPPRPSA